MSSISLDGGERQCLQRGARCFSAATFSDPLPSSRKTSIPNRKPTISTAFFLYLLLPPSSILRSPHQPPMCVFSGSPVKPIPFAPRKTRNTSEKCACGCEMEEREAGGDLKVRRRHEDKRSPRTLWKGAQRRPFGEQLLPCRRTDSPPMITGSERERCPQSQFKMNPD